MNASSGSGEWPRVKASGLDMLVARMSWRRDWEVVTIAVRRRSTFLDGSFWGVKKSVDIVRVHTSRSAPMKYLIRLLLSSSALFASATVLLAQATTSDEEAAKTAAGCAVCGGGMIIVIIAVI